MSTLFESCSGNVISFRGDNDQNADSAMHAVQGQLPSFLGSINAVCARAQIPSATDSWNPIHVVLTHAASSALCLSIPFLQ